MSASAQLARSGVRSLFQPRSIAIVGASPDATRFGGRPLANLQMHGYDGALYPINPNYNEIRGLACYPRLSAVDAEIDAALLAIRADAIPASLQECAERRVKLAVVVSSGFAETGGPGIAMQKAIAGAAQDANVRLLGPNCLGFINGPDRIPAVATSAVERSGLWPGTISMVSHSGALGIVSVFVRAYDNGVGYRYLVSSGNEGDLHALELMQMFVDDPQTRVVAGLIEELRRPEELAPVAQAALAAGKPIIVLKIGRSEAGRRAASAHTAALAGRDVVYDAAFRAHGLIRVDDLDELWQVPNLFASVPLPAGRGVGVISTSGGLNGLLADLLHREGLHVPPLSSASVDDLRSKLPPHAVLENPLDLTGGLRDTSDEIAAFSTALTVLDRDPRIHVIVLGQIAVRQDYDSTLSALIGVVRELKKPVVLLSPGGSIAEPGLRPAHRSGVPLFTSPQRCARALHHLCEYADFVRAQTSRPKKSPVRRTERNADFLPNGQLNQMSTWDLLRQYGLPLVRRARCGSLTEVHIAAKKLGFPIAMKAVGLLHKSEVGGVQLNISDDLQLEESYIRFEKRFGPEVELQQMVVGGLEMIVGIQHDVNFGPVVVVGCGGILVELVGDTALAMPPVTEADALQLIAGLRSAELLRGFRGAPPADIAALASIVATVSDMALDLAGQIESLDLNPVIVLPEGKGASIVDASLVRRGDGARR
jgi:acetate---CoA ligase (ADP-forming)